MFTYNANYIPQEDRENTWWMYSGYNPEDMDPSDAMQIAWLNQQQAAENAGNYHNSFYQNPNSGLYDGVNNAAPQNVDEYGYSHFASDEDGDSPWYTSSYHTNGLHLAGNEDWGDIDDETINRLKDEAWEEKLTQLQNYYGWDPGEVERLRSWGRAPERR